MALRSSGSSRFRTDTAAEGNEREGGRQNAMANPPTIDFVTVAGARIEVRRQGKGAPVLLLHSEEALEIPSPFLDALAARHEVIAPFYPGFGKSDRPDWITNTDDLAYIMLDVAKALALPPLPVVGCGIGGWIAAEMATKTDAFASRLALVDAFGIKVGGPYDRDVADVWLLPPEKVTALRWADPAKGKRDLSGWSDDELAVVARNTETFARFCWDPYMHNPKLRHRLHRITVPTLLLWGEADGIVRPDYGRAYASLIPGARFDTVPAAGHYPHLEQTTSFIAKLAPFIA